MKTCFINRVCVLFGRAKDSLSDWLDSVSLFRTCMSICFCVAFDLGEHKVPAFEIASFQRSGPLQRIADSEFLKLTRDKSGNEINSLILLLPKSLKQSRFIG